MANTTTVQTWQFNVLRSSSTLTITSVSGKKSVTLNLKTLETVWDALTAQEQSVYAPIEDAATLNTTVAYELSMDEMKAVASIAQKCSGTPDKVIAQSAKVVLNGVSSRTASTVTDRQATDVEHRVSRLTNIIDALDDEFFMLQYDIPTAKADVCPSPCNLLWRYGFRTTLSVWILPKSSLEAQDIIDLLAVWKANGIKVRVMKYDESEVAAIKEMAREELDAEIRHIHTSLIENIANADKALAEAMNVCGPVTQVWMEKQDEYRDNRVRSMIRQASEALDNAIRCAELFDAAEKVDDLLTALRETVNSQRATFNARMVQRNRKPV